MTSEENSNNEKPVFNGAQCRWRVNFTRQNPITPTCVNSKTNLHKGDLFVLSLNDEGTEKILLEVDEERQMQSQHPEIIIDELIKRAFSVAGFMNNYYYAQKVLNKEKFSLYLIELLVKEQYLSRGDMWRFTRKLFNSTVYLKKPLDIFGMRASVYGLWVDSAPYRVSSGYVTNRTKVVFRSSSVCCTIFLQMSKEMWEFDHYGDTYYEKAVDGFLFDLFTRWKNMNCQHDVTMTLFSRVFYEAKSIEDFPKSLRNDINKDHRNRFYEDFYRVIYQNERYDDWLPRLAKIRQALVDYKDDIVDYHKKHLPKSEAEKMPKGTISCAADGNFLETLNLSSSVFERHFVDRAFDRLGQMSLVITPGAGVFEVDRELTNMTKQRVLDNGIGSDLVCLGEQPLFAVPLFKFLKTNPQTADDYQIPHWMNLSYYHKSTAPSCFKRYIPRLPFDDFRISNDTLNAQIVMNSIRDETFGKPPDEMMDEYDSEIFGSTRSERNGRIERINNPGPRLGRKRYPTTNAGYQPTIDEEVLREPKGIWILQNKNLNMVSSHDEPRPFNANVKDDLCLSTSNVNSASIAAVHQHYASINQALNITDYHTTDLQRFAKSADTTSFHPLNIDSRNVSKPKPLTNPFAPASIRIPMAPGRRRWAHTFPVGPSNIPWHFHHLRQSEETAKAKLLLRPTNYIELVLPGTSKRCLDGTNVKRLNHHAKSNSDFSSRPRRIVSPSHFEIRRDLLDRKDSATDENRTSTHLYNQRPAGKSLASKKEAKETIIWGPTGVEPWSAFMITGIDWKSLTIPASLPTTFDVAPTEESLRRDFKLIFYELIHSLPSFSDYEKKRKNVYYEKMTQLDPMERRRQVFDELIDQRLSQGFQMIVDIPVEVQKLMIENIRRTGYKETEHNRLLSIGRMYHMLSLVDEDARHQDSVVICVKQFNPEHVSQARKKEYRYRFQCPDSSNYDPAIYDLKIDSLESIPWNVIDNAVCSHGIGCYPTTDTIKYWRARLVLMPVSRDYTIKNIESGQTKCDSRQEMSPEDFFLYVEHFIRFMLMLNKLSRCRSMPSESIHRPIDPQTGKRRIDQHRRSSRNLGNLKTFKLEEIFSGEKRSIDELSDLMRDEQQGLSFVKDNVLPEFSFIATEALWWSIEHCEELQDERAAFELFQFLFSKGKIRHCTKSEENFRSGFFLFYVVTEKTEFFQLESHDYAEVEFSQTEFYIPSMDFLGFGESQPMRLLPKLIKQKTSEIENFPGPLKRICNVDGDPKGISDRREWAVAQYSAYYNPHCLFEIEIRWLTATACFLGDLITTWSQRTATILGPNQLSFHLVPIPCDPFAEFDPLRSAIYIPLDSTCLKDKLEHFSVQERTRKINTFQELIVKRYGFILNSCVRNENDKIYFVHISGGMLIYLVSEVFNVEFREHCKNVSSNSGTEKRKSTMNDGFYWCWNFCLSKKWRTTQTGEEKYQDIMLADFRAFCANDKNRLFNFWDEIDRKAEEIKSHQEKF